MFIACLFLQTRKELMKRNGLNIVQGLNLKQLGKSIKYMTINERDVLKLEKAKQLKSKEKAEKKAGIKESGINGEWEADHDFMCTSCDIVFDELREILHHKWEAHPYCLVAHITFRRDLRYKYLI